MTALILRYATIGVGVGCVAAVVGVSETKSVHIADRPLPVTTLAQGPELPRASVDTTLHRLNGREIIVRKGDNLQRAINRAERGDVIRVDPKGTWGAIVLPAKQGQGWVHIECLALSSLPPAGKRVSVQDAKYMPTILNITSGTPRPALNTELHASHYRIMGVRFKSRKFTRQGHNKMLMLGRGHSTMLAAKSPHDLPHHIVIDRCIVEGWPGNTTRGMYLDGRHVAVIGSQIKDITAPSESHGILITDTPGPILIENNAIGASGVNIFIGDDNALRWQGVNAADITIRNNLLYKKPAWKATHGLKNHFEMKRGQRVLFENNECVYSPIDAQTGFSIKLKTGGHDQYVQDVTIRHNRIRQVNGYIAISNRDADETVRRILSYGNDVDGLFGDGISVMIFVEHDAALISDIALIGDQLRGPALRSFVALSGRAPCVERFECRDLRADHGQYGIKGDGARTGTASLEKFCRGYLFRGNSLYGTTTANVAKLYPAGNQHAGPTR